MRAKKDLLGDLEQQILDTEPTERDEGNALRLLENASYSTVAVLALINVLEEWDADDEAECLIRVLDKLAKAEARSL